MRVLILGGALGNPGLPDKGFLILDFLFEASAYQKPICWGGGASQSKALFSNLILSSARQLRNYLRKRLPKMLINRAQFPTQAQLSLSESVHAYPSPTCNTNPNV